MKVNKSENQMCLVACALLFFCPVLSKAQASQSATAGSPAGVQSTVLPDAPTPATGKAVVSGTVLDPSGAAVSGAAVLLTRIGESQGRFLTTAADGSFSFRDVPPGSYIVSVQAKDFQPATSAQFAVKADQSYEVPNVILLIAADTTVVVEPTEVIAAQQVKAEEKQRVFGIVPDFYTSYVWDAAPLNTKQKYSLALRDTFDPMAFVGVSIGAGIQLATNSYSGYGQGVEGYSKRWGALFANGRTSDLLSHAVFPSLFHQDPRYFYQGSGSTWSRIEHAVGQAFVARSDSGKMMPNYSYLFGDLASGGISNLYYPASSRGASLVFENSAIGIAGRAVQNLFREFLNKHITKNVPGNGKPTAGNP
jgi:hypothetical protein